MLVAILHRELKLPGSLHLTLQILSTHLLEKISLHELLVINKFRKPASRNLNQIGVV
jgi:hypothetical protein